MDKYGLKQQVVDALGRYKEHLLGVSNDELLIELNYLEFAHSQLVEFGSVVGDDTHEVALAVAFESTNSDAHQGLYQLLKLHLYNVISQRLNAK